MSETACPTCGLPAQTPSNSHWRLGLIAGIAVIVVILLFAGSEAGKPAPSAPSSQHSPTPSVAGKPPSRGLPRRGDTVTANPAYVPALCIETKEGFGEGSRWLSRRDFEEVARVILRHGGQLIESGEQLKVLDPGFMTTAKVRILSSGRECYTIAEVTR